MMACATLLSGRTLRNGGAIRSVDPGDPWVRAFCHTEAAVPQSTRLAEAPQFR